MGIKGGTVVEPVGGNQTFRFAEPDEKLESSLSSLIEFVNPKLDIWKSYEFNFSLDDIVLKLPEQERNEFRSYAVRLFEGISPDRVIDTREERSIFEGVASEAAMRIAEDFAESSSDPSAWLGLDAAALQALILLPEFADFRNPKAIKRVNDILGSIDPSPLKDLDILSQLFKIKHSEKNYEGETVEKTFLYELIRTLLIRRNIDKDVQEHLELTIIDIFENFPEETDVFFFGLAFGMATSEGHLRDYFYSEEPPEIIEAYFRAYPEKMVDLLEKSADRGHPTSLKMLEEIMLGRSPFNRVLMRKNLMYVEREDENLSIDELLRRYGKRNNEADIYIILHRMITEEKIPKGVLPQFKDAYGDYKDRITRLFFERLINGNADVEDGFLLHAIIKYDPEKILSLMDGAREDQAIPLPSIGRLSDEMLNRHGYYWSVEKTAEVVEFEKRLAKLKSDAGISGVENADLRSLAALMIANRNTDGDDLAILSQLAKMGYTQAIERMEDIANSGRPPAILAVNKLAKYLDVTDTWLLERPDVLDSHNINARSADLRDADTKLIERMHEDVVRFFDAEIDVDSWMRLIAPAEKMDDDLVNRRIYAIDIYESINMAAYDHIEDAIYNAQSPPAMEERNVLRKSYEIVRRSALSDDKKIAEEAVNTLSRMFLDFPKYRVLSPSPFQTISAIIANDGPAAGKAWDSAKSIFEAEGGKTAADFKEGDRPRFDEVTREMIGIAEGQNAHSIDAFETLAQYARGMAQDEFSGNFELELRMSKRPITAENASRLKGRIPNLRINGLIAMMSIDARVTSILKDLALLGHEGAFSVILNEFRGGNADMLSILDEMLRDDESVRSDAIHLRAIETAISMSLSGVAAQMALGEELLKGAVKYDRAGAFMGLYEVAGEYMGTPHPLIDLLLDGVDSAHNAEEQAGARENFDRDLAGHIESLIPFIEDGETLEPVIRDHARKLAFKGFFAGSNRINEFDRLYREYIESQVAAGGMDEEGKRAALEGIPETDDAAAASTDGGVTHIQRSSGFGTAPEGIIVESGRDGGKLTVNGSANTAGDKGRSGGSEIGEIGDIKDAISDFSVDTSSSPVLKRLEDMINLAMEDSDDPLVEYAREQLSLLITQHHEFALIGNMDSLNLIYTIVVVSDCKYEEAKESLIDISHSSWASDVLFQAKSYINDLKLIYPDEEFNWD